MLHFSQSLLRIYRLALPALVVLLLFGCGQDDEDYSSQSRPWEFRYQYDHTIIFGYGGDAERHMIRGWSALEPDHTWTSDPVALLGFLVGESVAPVNLIVKTGAMIHPPQIPFQLVDVYADRVKIATWQVSDFATYTAPIPRRFTSGREHPLFIRFEIPNAVSLKELGQKDDERKLGLMVAEATLSPSGEAQPDSARDYTYGEKIYFGTGGNAHKYCTKGWSSVEQHSTWTDGLLAAMRFTLPHSDGPVILYMRAGGMHGEPRAPSAHRIVRSQGVEVSVRGEVIARWDVCEETLLTAVIPHYLVSAPHNDVSIEFSLPDATAPAELGHNADGRKLGMRVFSAAIAEQPPAFREERRKAGEE